MVRGFVPDMAAETRAAQVVVCPVRFGSGVKTKCLEAMLACRALVATPLAMEGIAGASGEAWVEAQTSDSFADACVELLEDVDRRRRLGVAARQAVEARHSLDGHLDTLMALASQVAEGAFPSS